MRSSARPARSGLKFFSSLIPVLEAVKKSKHTRLSYAISTMSKNEKETGLGERLRGSGRVKVINRRQMILRPTDAEALVEADHPVRAIWELTGWLKRLSAIKAYGFTGFHLEHSGPWFGPDHSQPVTLEAKMKCGLYIESSIEFFTASSQINYLKMAPTYTSEKGSHLHRR